MSHVSDGQALALLRSGSTRNLCQATPVECHGADGAWQIVRAKPGRGFELHPETVFAVRLAGETGVGRSLAAAKRKALEPYRKVLAPVSAAPTGA